MEARNLELKTHRPAVTNITINNPPFKRQIKIINTQLDKKKKAVAKSFPYDCL